VRSTVTTSATTIMTSVMLLVASVI
jgi:hypothetical protein